MGAHQGGREAAVPVMPAQSYHRGGGNGATAAQRGMATRVGIAGDYGAKSLYSVTVLRVC